VSRVPDQARRREAIAEAHPEVDWIGRIGGIYAAYVHLPHDGGYQAGGKTLAELLDKLARFFGEDPGG
jgi:hypothetical protein